MKTPSSWRISRVYPRVCGGTKGGGNVIRTGLGLSPRVRGNRRKNLWMGLPTRSIPACAGEPVVGVDAAIFNKVYPRVCGGTASSCGRSRRICGLSPRVRGNPDDLSRTLARTRSIPACAGEPSSDQSHWKTRTVYPRVCGGT